MSKYGGYEDLPFLAELYDLVPAYSSRRDLAFYLDLCRTAAGDVLELGCGTGRVLIPAASAGVRMVGLDLSPHMLAKCREKLRSEPAEVRSRVQLVQQTMTDFRLDRTFDLAILPFRPFQHLVELEDQIACLRCVNEHLNPGGRLAFDLFQVDFRKIERAKTGEEREDLPEITLPDGRKLRRCSRFAGMHRAEQVNDVELIYYLSGTDGKTERFVQRFPFRCFFRYEVEHLLWRCGFEVVDLFGDFDRSTLSDDSPEMIFVSRKRGDAV